MLKKSEIGIYIHIPFCIQKCYYCDFVSFANVQELQEQYIQKLIEEIEQEKEIFNKYKVTTIYIGGGTPSVIDSNLIKKVLKVLENIIKESSNYDDLVLENIEITIEVNPRNRHKKEIARLQTSKY